MPKNSNGVFINVPFDRRYQKLFDALVFALHDCGFEARCALERADGGQVRLDKLFEIIEQCRYGVHDLSRVTLDTRNRLPRFNMPLELGIFLGAKRYGGAAQKQKSCIIFDRDQYRFQIFCSDIAGQDIRAHQNDVLHAIRAVRAFLRTERPNVGIPGPTAIAQRYIQFRRALPKLCKQLSLTVRDLVFLDYRLLVANWIQKNPIA